MSTASPPKSLTAQCEEILADIKRFEQSASGRELSQTDRAERLRLVQSLDKLALRLKDPREAIFDQFTNVGILFSFLSLALSCLSGLAVWWCCGSLGSVKVAPWFEL